MKDGLTAAAKDYDRIQGALEYIAEHQREQPSLERLAKAAGMSPAHFQRTFTKWVGVSPKQFVSYMSLGRAKDELARKLPVMTAAYRASLSGSGRLHDLFVSIERMTPGEYKNGGAGLSIRYSTADSAFGRYIVASTPRGVCYLYFFDGSEAQAIRKLKAKWPRAAFEKKADASHQQIARFFARHLKRGERITLHLAGTPFQLKVWEALLSIPSGAVVPYASVAKGAGKPLAVRAAASAVGDNPVCYLIPCHRVIRGTGAMGNYGGGVARKAGMLGWEACQAD